MGFDLASKRSSRRPDAFASTRDGSAAQTREFELILIAQRPRFDATVAQIACKLGRKTVECEHPFWLHQIDIAKQIVVIGVIGERKRGVNLITINRIGIDRPATDHGDAFARNLFQHARAIRARRTNENFSRDLVSAVADVFAKRLAELFVNLCHLINGAMQHRCQPSSVE